MSSIRTRTGAAGEVSYQVLYRDRGVQRAKTFSRSRPAEKFATDVAQQLDAGTYRHVAPILMADVFRQWADKLAADVALGSIKRSTARAYASIVTHHLAEPFGRIASDRLTAADIERWRQANADKVKAGDVAPKTHNNTVALFRGILDWAVEHQWMGGNPMPKKRMRARVVAVERAIVEGEDKDRLWHATSGAARVIIALALFAGLRRGEIFGLRWKDLRWPAEGERGHVAIVNTYVQSEMVPPKTEASRRFVDLWPRLAAILEAHHTACPPKTCPEGPGEGMAFVIRQADGRPVDPDNWTKDELPALRAAAGIAANVTLHGLRHTFGSVQLAANQPAKYVSEQMGHASVAFTQDVYQHVLAVTRARGRDITDQQIPADPPPATRRQDGRSRAAQGRGPRLVHAR